VLSFLKPNDNDYCTDMMKGFHLLSNLRSTILRFLEASSIPIIILLGHSQFYNYFVQAAPATIYPHNI
jgi:hypothetical protein